MRPPLTSKMSRAGRTYPPPLSEPIVLDQKVVGDQIRTFKDAKQKRLSYEKSKIFRNSSAHLRRLL